jgi:hypothetical protein
MAGSEGHLVLSRRLPKTAQRIISAPLSALRNHQGMVQLTWLYEAAVGCGGMQLRPAVSTNVVGKMPLH